MIVIMETLNNSLKTIMLKSNQIVRRLTDINVMCINIHIHINMYKICVVCVKYIAIH